MANRIVLAIFNNLTRHLYSIIFNDEESSSDDENEIDEIFNGQVVKRRRGEIVRILNYVEITVPRYTNTQFQEHFRVTRVAYEELLGLVGPIIKGDHEVGRPNIDPERQLLSVLWLLATPDSYRSVGDRFNISKSSLFVSFVRVISALNAIAPQVIKWPTGDRLRNIKTSFQRMAGVPNVIGAIDGTFIPIKAPSLNAEVYVTRKCNYAITLQAICDSNLEFTDVFVGYPGSVSDTRIFRNSDFYRDVEENRARYFPEGTFIIGDKAYPCLEWCISSYIDRGNLTAAQKNFNHRISQTRQTIERCFALLFGRYRRLKFLDMNRTDLIPPTILAACVMHNICLNHADAQLRNYENEGIIDVNNDDHDVNREQNNFNNILGGLLFRNNLCEMLNNNVE